MSVKLEERRSLVVPVHLRGSKNTQKHLAVELTFRVAIQPPFRARKKRKSHAAAERGFRFFLSYLLSECCCEDGKTAAD